MSTETPSKLNLSVATTVQQRIFCCISRDVTIHATNAPTAIHTSAEIVQKTEDITLDVPVVENQEK